MFGDVARRQEVADGKQNQKEFDGGADRVVLVRRLDVAEEDGGAGDFVELGVGGVEDREEVGLEGGEVAAFGEEGCGRVEGHLLGAHGRVQVVVMGTRSTRGPHQGHFRLENDAARKEPGSSHVPAAEKCNPISLFN